MRTEHGKIEGPFTIEEDLALHGMIAGIATVRSGVYLILHGTVVGDLVIEAGANADIHGTVNGTVINDGGRIKIFGVVDAVLDRSVKATTTIDPKAVIRNR